MKPKTIPLLFINSNLAMRSCKLSMSLGFFREQSTDYNEDIDLVVKVIVSFMHLLRSYLVNGRMREKGERV